MKGTIKISRSYKSIQDYVPSSMETAILELIQNGIKAVSLVTRAVSLQNEKEKILVKNPHFNEEVCSSVSVYEEAFVPVYEEVGDIVLYIDKLVKQGKIIELEYVLPFSDYRVKSMYFPAGTKFEFSNKDSSNDN